MTSKSNFINHLCGLKRDQIRGQKLVPGALDSPPELGNIRRYTGRLREDRDAIIIGNSFA
jgi:hypothetical protein